MVLGTLINTDIDIYLITEEPANRKIGIRD